MFAHASVNQLRQPGLILSQGSASLSAILSSFEGSHKVNILVEWIKSINKLTITLTRAGTKCAQSHKIRSTAEKPAL